MYTDVSEEPAACVISVDDEDSRSVSFVSTLVPDYTMSHLIDTSSQLHH